MAFVKRENGKVVTYCPGFVAGMAEEEIADNHPDLLAFLNPGQTIDEQRTTAVLRIDEAAEAARLRYITGGSGQAMTYQQKSAEADAVLKAAAPDPEDYPLLAAEIGITAPTLLEVATVVNGAYQQWRIVGAQIEALRLGGKAAVAAAQTIEDVQAAADIDWP